MSLHTPAHWQKQNKKRTRPKTKFEKRAARLDYYFNRWVRLSSMDDLGMVVCWSCGNQRPWNKMSAGHFIGKSKTTYRTRWDPKNVHPQCIPCNSFDEGNKYQYGVTINNFYGDGTTEALKIKSTKPFNPDIFDIEGKIKFYREECKKLEPQKEGNNVKGIDNNTQ